jgi:hypothetical protein
VTRRAASWDRRMPVRRYRRLRLYEFDLPPAKGEAECCLSRRDEAGRLPVGFCSPGCARRPTNWPRPTGASAPPDTKEEP